MKKRLLALMLALISVVCFGCGNQTDSVIDVLEQTPTPDDSGVVLSLSIPENNRLGMVAAGDLHTVGLRSDGTIIVTGHNTAGQCSVTGWSGVVAIAAGGELTACVTYAGSVAVAGSDTLSAEVQGWTDIAAVAVGAGHIIGLKTNGTVVSAGDNAMGQCNVNAWTDVVAIAAAGNHSVGLMSDGTVVATGDNAMGQCNITDWSGVTAIAAGADQTAALLSDGTAVSTKNDVSAWSDIVSIAAGGTATYGVTGSGTVVCVPQDAAAATITDAESIVAGAAHAVVLKTDGSVAAFGSDSDFQCGVSNWQITPYMDGTYIMGFALNSTVASTKALMAAYTGKESIELRSSDGALTDDDVICTGTEVYADGASFATIVLLGDVNGDGIINTTDSELVEKHLGGKSEDQLTGAALRAAAVKPNADGTLNTSCLNAIDRHANGSISLSQFPAVGENKYDDEIAAAEAVNSDVVGWIAIDGTVISYPIMYSAKTQWYYNNRNLQKEKIESGSIFAFYNQYVQNNVITGHNSRVSGTMFHQLHHVQEYNMGETTCAYAKCTSPDLTGAGLPDFSTYKGRIFTINIYGEEAQWEIFSMYESTRDATIEDLYYNTWYPPDKYWLSSNEKIQKWITHQLDNTQYDFGVTPTPDDTFVTLYTCGNEHADSSDGHVSRLWFFLRKVG